MQRNNRLALAAATAVFALIGPYARADWYTSSYEGDALPHEAPTNPLWNKILDSGDVGTVTYSTNNGILTVNTGAITDYVEWRIDGGTGSAWNPTGAGSTFEVRLKTDFNVAGADWAGSFSLITGGRAWVMVVGAHFITDAAGGGDLAITTNDAFHTYRFTVADETNGPLSLYVDNGTVPVKTWAGAPSGSNRIGFGDLTASHEGGQIQWDYLRWTNAGAIVPVPPEPTWVLDDSGDWNKPLNWGGQVPNAIGAVANLTTVITTARSVYTETPVTVGTLRFNNANRYNITGNGSLTLQVASGAGSIDVQAGSQKINLPLFFASDTNVSVATGAELLISNPATIMAGKTVTKTGTVLVQAPLTLEAGAVLALAGGQTSIWGAPSAAAGAKIDVKNNALTVDYRGLSGQADAVKAQLTTGYNAGAWNGDGIATSSAVAGQGLGWVDDSANQQVLVKYTYYGDTNLDGQVDITDLGNLATAWQTAGVWAAGDSDYSGFIDITDLGALATNWQAGVPSFNEALAAVGLGGVTVPEPGMLGLGLLCGSGLIGRRRR